MPHPALTGQVRFGLLQKRSQVGFADLQIRWMKLRSSIWPNPLLRLRRRHGRLTVITSDGRQWNVSPGFLRRANVTKTVTPKALPGK